MFCPILLFMASTSSHSLFIFVLLSFFLFLGPSMFTFRIPLPPSLSVPALSSSSFRFFVPMLSYFIHFFFLAMSFHLCSSTVWPHTFPETRALSFATRFYRPVTYALYPLSTDTVTLHRVYYVRLRTRIGPSARFKPLCGSVITADGNNCGSNNFSFRLRHWHMHRHV